MVKLGPAGAVRSKKRCNNEADGMEKLSKKQRIFVS
jgi:hypothetical protein